MTPHETGRQRYAALIVIAGCSGFAGLGYEIVWTRLLANVFGHEIVAVLGVIVALFGGLALGSLLLGRRISESASPARWYMGLELAIGVWAVLLIPLLPLLGRLAPVLIPVDASELRQWAVAFMVPLLVLLPATLAMGATLPALEAILAPLLTRGHAVGWAYAANTFGAVIGTLATTFAVMPALGLSLTLASLAAVNLICAGGMALVDNGAATRAPMSYTSLDIGSRLPSLFLTGLLGIGYEVVAVRTLNQVLENTVYTFAALLSVYLLGTAMGAALHARLPKGKDLIAWRAVAASVACICGVVALGNVDTLQTMLRGLPPTVTGAVTGELVLAAFVFLLPTIAMGALFTELAQASRDRDGSLGPALAANTAGAALAPILFGPVLFPLLGAKLALVLIAAGYAFVAPAFRVRAFSLRAAAAGLALGLLIAPLSLRFVVIPPGGGILWHRDGVMAGVSVVEDRAHDRHLEINNHFRMGGTASIRSDYREADIPLLLHANPKHALFLGLGTGATISAAADHPGLDIDGVELVPEVPETFVLFGKAAPNIGRPNIHIHTADARRYVQAATARYDMVMADVYHPWIDGAGTLYTREHFAAIKELLAEDGLFCQWLPLHQLDLPTLKVILRTFLAEFPHATAYLAQFSVGTPLIGLIGRKDEKIYPSDWLAQRVTDEKLRTRLASVELTGDMALFGMFLADTKTLAAYAGDAPINTDDHQVVTFNAPRATYATTESPGDRLIALLAALHSEPGAVLKADGQRLADYWRARDRFLELGVETTQSSQIRDVIAEVAPKLIEIVQISPDFDSAYRPVLAMAEQLARTDPAGARKLLEELDRANPARAEARRQLASLPAY